MLIANCGVAEVDEVKLQDCDQCDLARYCTDECRTNHQQYHRSICKERAAELHDKLLFRQPESSCYGDCPICFLPLPLDASKCTMSSCCSKVICKGCDFANKVREEEQRLKHKCPFCRKLLPETDEECDKRLMERAEVNDPTALRNLGTMKEDKEGHYDSALQYYSRAAELGDAIAQYYLSIMYHKGVGVEKDERKEVFHLEEAAIAGHPVARHNLAVYEWMNKRFDKRFDRAATHLIIAANLGHNESIQALKDYYKDGHISKDDFEAALRAHHATVDATKSPQREAAKEHV